MRALFRRRAYRLRYLLTDSSTASSRISGTTSRSARRQIVRATCKCALASPPDYSKVQRARTAGGQQERREPSAAAAAWRTGRMKRVSGGSLASSSSIQLSSVCTFDMAKDTRSVYQLAVSDSESSSRRSRSRRYLA